MSKEKAANATKSRQWTSNKMCLFAEVLVDDEDGFADALERLALKKATNNEVFRHIKLKFDAALKNESFHTKNIADNFSDKKYTKLDTSVLKLRRKYTNLKHEWRTITDRVKSGSGLAPKNEPPWYRFMNQVFSETNEEVSLSSQNADLSFNGQFNHDHSDDMDESSSSESDSEGGDKSVDHGHEIQVQTEEGRNSNTRARQDSSSSTSNSTGKQKAREKTVALPHKKRRVRSQVEAKADMARSFAKFAEGQERRWRVGREEDRRRDDIFLQFKREEAEKNRQHELKLAEMFATTLSNRCPQQDQQPYQSHTPGSLFSRYSTAASRVYENLTPSRPYSPEYPPQYD